MQAKYGENEIKSLLQKVRIFNKDIGSYQLFAITENFDYAVKLTNGKILLKLEELQDDEHEALTPDHLAVIANRFVSSISQTNTHQNDDQTQAIPHIPKLKKKKGNINKTILTTLISFIIIICIFAILKNLNRDNKGKGNGDSYQEKIMTIEEIERSQPTNFISTNGTFRGNFLGDKLIIDCIITNKATVVTYKDVIIKITYYTKTKTEIGTKKHTIYELFPPNSQKTIVLKVDNYKDVKSIGWDIISATPY